MGNLSFHSPDFLAQITSVVEENIANEQFGVSELADALNMSRSNLLRKVKKEAKLSVSQLIRQIRLKRGMELLRTTSLNVSEVSHQVGFGSTSYFIKCFREYYGYPPGEVGHRDETTAPDVPQEKAPRRMKLTWLAASLGVLVIVAGVFIYYQFSETSAPASVPPEKSIAVLPFKNESSDSTNIYLINGLMESTLNNLQKIKDLRVISRTSSERYRNTSKSIPEMAEELDVNYFVEGSGQKIGDRILLTIQLIDATRDRHLWSKQYRKEASDIFQLQQEVAKDIVEEIQVFITPEEEQRIQKRPTKNLAAYDLFLKGRDLLMQGGDDNLVQAIQYFDEAIQQDQQFAQAYAYAAIACYYLETFSAEKKRLTDLEHYADKALLHDPALTEGLMAKGLYYLQSKEYALALPYLEKAHEYSPNSLTIVNLLADYFANYNPNTSRYLEYALKALRLGAVSDDSVTISYNYLRLGNALAQTGFLDEALHYLNKSITLYPDNQYSNWVKAWVLYAKHRNGEQTKDLLLKVLEKDTTRLEILQDVGKIYYMMRDYENAYRYYKQFVKIREAAHFDIYSHESLKMATVYSAMGYKKEAEEFLAVFKQYADTDHSIYKQGNLAGYYVYTGDYTKAIEHLREFSKEENLQFWTLFINDDPVMDAIKQKPEFKKVVRQIEERFWKQHNETRTMLQEKGLLP